MTGRENLFDRPVPVCFHENAPFAWGEKRGLPDASQGFLQVMLLFGKGLEYNPMGVGQKKHPKPKRLHGKTYDKNLHFSCL